MAMRFVYNSTDLGATAVRLGQVPGFITDTDKIFVARGDDGSVVSIFRRNVSAISTGFFLRALAS